MDDILLTGDDTEGIAKVKQHIQSHFIIKDLGRPRYFLGLEIAYYTDGVSLSQESIHLIC